VGGPGNPAAAVGSVLRLGDAAGFADPLTGEGIYWALLSATLAAEAITGTHRFREAAAAEYQRLVDRRTRPGLRRLARLFYRYVHRAAPFLEKRPELARDFWEAIYMGDYERLRFRRLLPALFRAIRKGSCGKRGTGTFFRSHIRLGRSDCSRYFRVLKVLGQFLKKEPVPVFRPLFRCSCRSGAPVAKGTALP